jgi:transposase
LLLVGIDWAETQHAICLLTPAGTVITRFTIGHDVAGVQQLQAAIAAQEPEAAAVLVAIERPDGLLVDAVLAAGYTIYALNPKSVERYRSRTRMTNAKSDPADAELLARILLTDRDRHAPLQRSSALAEEIRVLAREDETASREVRRLANRLRQILLAVFPQALVAFPDVTSVAALTCLERWPTADHARTATLVELTALLRAHHHSQPAAAAERSHTAFQAAALAAPTHLAQAQAETVQLLVRQLLLLQRQRRAWERRLQTLLTGPEAHPDGEILLSLPGLAPRLAARVLGEVGDRRDLFPTAAALQCYAGTAPVTRASGKSRHVQARWACNRRLRQAVLQWAYCSLPFSAWAKAHYAAQRAVGHRHFAALRAVANRWLEVLHHLLSKRVRYDEALHQRNRTKPPRPVAA